MAADLREGNEPYDDINITPMLDLAYVLLVTFIIMTTASVQGVKVESPKTKVTAQLAKPQTKAITVTREGNIFLDAYPVSVDELAQRLGALRASNPNLPVVLKADSATPYQKIMEVLEVVKRLDITELGLVTQRAAP